MTEDPSKSGGAATVVVVVLLLLALPCAAGLLFTGGLFLVRLKVQPIPLPPVPGANAPPGSPPTPAHTEITVSSMTWSQNLFGESAEILTLARYEQIKLGMTYEELVSVLGIPENRSPPDIEHVGPGSNVELKWFGPDDELSITVKLKGKVVVDKTQSGLK
jgi:hypothetical protein